MSSAYFERRMAALGVRPRLRPKRRLKPAPRMWHSKAIPLTANTMANKYVKTTRGRYDGPASWFDVRDAYLAGFAVGYSYPDKPTGE